MIRTFVIALTGLTLAQSAAFSQQSSQEPVPQQQVQPAAPSPTVPGEAAGRVSRIRDVLGLEVVSEKGESFGVVDDLTFDKQTGQIEYALIAPEDNSRDLYPMPWKAISIYQGEDPQDHYLIVALDQDRFQKAPTITREQWPTMTYTQWNTYVPRVTTYYGEVRAIPPRAVRRAARAVRRVLD
jgi:sporulation protein YlmC with PRC-barrel domain